MSSGKDVKAFVADVTAQDGWEWSIDGKNHLRITNPEGRYIALSSTPSDVQWRENELARLKRDLGYDPEAAKAAKKRQSTERLRLDRERGIAAMERAERDAAIRQRLADEVAKAAREGAYGEIEIGGGLLKGWPTSYRRITIAEALEEINRYDRGCCPRRSLKQSNVDNWIVTMEGGAFRLTGSPIIYTNCKNRCLANGQHRFWAMQLADREKMELHYPHGVPFQVIEEFPPELIHTLDSGENRSFKNILELSGQDANASAVGTAVRLAMLYDRSFQENGAPWGAWNKVSITNTEFQVAVRGDYATVGDWSKAASRLFNRARVTKSAGTVLYFVLNRDADAPDAVEEFFSGVMGNALTGDPRREFAQFTMLARQGKRKQAQHPGAQQLGMGLLAYARWRMDPAWTVSQMKFDTDQRMWAVYKPGMQIIKGDLRHPYR